MDIGNNITFRLFVKNLDLRNMKILLKEFRPQETSISKQDKLNLLSVNTAVSFITNTNWQGYGGESTMGYLTQMLGLGVQNFVSAASGMAVLVALLGAENVSAVPLESFGTRFGLMPTIGKLANVIPEIGELDRVAEGAFKSFVAGICRLSTARTYHPCKPTRRPA